MDINIIKALADENRQHIVELLSDRGELCICEVASALGLSDALVSHHVGRLREVGLVSTRRVGKWLHCSLQPAVLESLSSSIDAVVEASRASAASDSCVCATTDSGGS